MSRDERKPSGLAGQEADRFTRFVTGTVGLPSTAGPQDVWFRLHWPFVTALGVVFLILFRGTLPDWAIAPPELWTTNLPLPFLIFGDAFFSALTINGSSVAD